MNHATTSASVAKSCLECRRRKIKCNKAIPCSYCVKIKIQCRYPEPKSNHNKGAGSSLTKEALSTRIDGIENVLQSVEQSISQMWGLLHQDQTSSSRSGQSEQRGPETSSVNAQNLRTGLASYRSGVAHLDQNEPSSRCLPPCDSASSQIALSSEASLHFHHPPSSTIFSLWQRYLERVDPVLKLFHAPTVQQDIANVLRDSSYLDWARHTLLFSIYYSSVITMTTEECRNEFQTSKEAALKRFRDELENSLERSNLFSTSNLVILQAFVLYIVCGRCDKQGPNTKRLTEVAINIAFQNKLHRDGLELEISPFEVEMRRRLWWQICILDVRTAEDNGSDPHILSSSFTTQFPSNVNDASLHPDMSEMPQGSPGRTEMTFTLVRFEGSNFARQIVFSDRFCKENFHSLMSAPEKCIAINTFRERIEQQYLSRLDKSIPLDFITAASIRLILVKLKLTVNKPRKRSNQHLIMQPSFRTTCVEILQRARLLRQYEKGKQWLWLFQTYVEWDALSYLLINLSLVPGSENVDLAWNAASDVYDYWKHHSDVCLDRRWRNIEALRSQALHARELLRREPSAFSTPTVNSYGSVHIDPVRPDSVEPDALGESALVSQTGMVLPGPQVEQLAGNLDTPSAGTGCQWSAALFEKYFEVLGSEHGFHNSWL